jgi:outer membrane protein OmpA-like peptidoglycan-associated protein
MKQTTTLLRKWTLIILSSLVFSSLKAQIRLAAYGGIHSANILEKNSIPGWDTAYGNYYSPITGFQLGLLAEIPLGNHGFFFQPGMGYSSKGRQFAKTYDSSSAQFADTLYSQTKLKLGYIELPMYITYKIPLSKDHKNNFFLSAGPYFSFFFNGTLNVQSHLASTNKFSEENIDLATGNAPGQYNSFDFGMNAKAGFELGSIIISGYFSRGFTSMYTASYESTFHHQLFGASIGFWLTKQIPSEPVKEKDSDLDGVPDKYDSCPDIAGSVKWRGCPVPDSDHDGVNDEEDSCRLIAGSAKYHGCPIPDSDGDGVNDEEDSCKLIAGSPKYHGCPVPDRDHDGINDDDDHCPDQAGPPENFGCPVIKKEIIEKVNYEARNVMFESSSSKLTSSSYGALNDLIVLLKKNPELHLTIEGFTDNTGGEKYNLSLSQRRADRVKNYLVGKGIATERIKAIGYGTARPISDNKSKEGKSMNRRVEFKLDQ